MSDKEILAKIIRDLRGCTPPLSSGDVEKATKTLAKIRTYNRDKFPKLVDTDKFKDTSGTTPGNLAEALLWKLGKWKVYKNFASNFTNSQPKITQTDVVLSAFARHLKNTGAPIYDQHALRALWAISSEFSASDVKNCKSVLFDGKNKWKKSGSGGDTVKCYELFLTHMKTLAESNNAASMEALDKLLMPLGQAIKRSTGSYKEFCELCNFRSEA